MRERPIYSSSEDPKYTKAQDVYFLLNCLRNVKSKKGTLTAKIDGHAFRGDIMHALESRLSPYLELSDGKYLQIHLRAFSTTPIERGEFTVLAGARKTVIKLEKRNYRNPKAVEIPYQEDITDFTAIIEYTLPAAVTSPPLSREEIGQIFLEQQKLLSPKVYHENKKVSPQKIREKPRRKKLSHLITQIFKTLPFQIKK